MISSMARSELGEPKRPKRVVSSHVRVTFARGESLRVARIFLKYFTLIRYDEDAIEDDDASDRKSVDAVFDSMNYGESNDEAEVVEEVEEEEEEADDDGVDDAMCTVNEVTLETFCELMKFAKALSAVEHRLFDRPLRVPCGPFVNEPAGKRHLAAHLPRVAGNLAMSIEKLDFERLVRLTRGANYLGFETFVKLVILRETLACLHLPPVLIKMRGKFTNSAIDSSAC